jgi:PIN domain nuclease of toxin-antitoxin system
VDYLLDTHTLIWHIEGNNNLPAEILAIIQDKRHKKYISIASVWEMGIKYSLGKLLLAKSFEGFLGDLSDTSIEVLSLTIPQIIRVSSLPIIHKDPFDRIIIAQALEENLCIIGRDSHFASYSVQIIWN